MWVGGLVQQTFNSWTDLYLDRNILCMSDVYHSHPCAVQNDFTRFPETVFSSAFWLTAKQSCVEKNICLLKCRTEKSDNVTWSRDVDGKREKINKNLTRYRSGGGLILSIFKVSFSDAGRYYCNDNTVELRVKSKAEITTRSGKCSVTQNWLHYHCPIIILKNTFIIFSILSLYFK